jgi:hypothetical protein
MLYAYLRKPSTNFPYYFLGHAPEMLSVASFYIDHTPFSLLFFFAARQQRICCPHPFLFSFSFSFLFASRTQRTPLQHVSLRLLFTFLFLFSFSSPARAREVLLSLQLGPQ